MFTIATCLLVYQFSQEFFGFVTSKGISEGMLPPPPLVSALTSLLCICVTVWTHLSAGNSTAALAVSSFLVLSLQLLTVERPHFSQMTSTVFGLFYCGESPASCSLTISQSCSTCCALTQGILRVHPPYFRLSCAWASAPPVKSLCWCRLPAQFLGQAASCGCACHQQYIGAWLAGESSPPQVKDLCSAAAEPRSPKSCTAVCSPCVPMQQGCERVHASCWAQTPPASGSSDCAQRTRWHVGPTRYQRLMP